MSEILKICSAIIASVGGASVIILWISKYISELISNIILDKVKAKYEKDLADYKSKIDTELNKVDKINDKALYISKYQFENEYKMYMEIWKNMRLCILHTLNLYPQGIENVPIDENAEKEFKKEKYRKFSDNYNLYSDSIDNYAPFYKEEFLNTFEKILKICKEIGIKYSMYEIEPEYNISFASLKDTSLSIDELRKIHKKCDELLELKQHIQVEIRNYLDNMNI